MTFKSPNFIVKDPATVVVFVFKARKWNKKPYTIPLDWSWYWEEQDGDSVAKLHLHVTNGRVGMRSSNCLEDHSLHLQRLSSSVPSCCWFSRLWKSFQKIKGFQGLLRLLRTLTGFQACLWILSAQGISSTRGLSRTVWTLSYLHRQLLWSNLCCCFCFPKATCMGIQFTITTKMCVGIILKIFVFVSSTFFFKAHKGLEQIINQPTRQKWFFFVCFWTGPSKN